MAGFRWKQLEYQIQDGQCIVDRNSPPFDGEPVLLCYRMAASSNVVGFLRPGRGWVTGNLWSGKALMTTSIPWGIIFGGRSSISGGMRR